MHNWGQAFNEYAFGAWAGTGTHIDTTGYTPQSSVVFILSLVHTVVDIFLHVGNCFNVYGFLQLFNPYAYLLGVRRGCTADDAVQ